MKLYYSPGACSLASHITLRELGLPFQAVKVDLEKRITAAGPRLDVVNPKGYVPVLELDDSAVLTEGPVIMQYLADRHPQAGLAPASGMARYRLQEWLGFINSEVHKSYSPLFAPDAPQETKDAAKAKLAKRFDYLQGVLAKQTYLMGEAFSIADAYLYTVLCWAGFVGIDLGRWPALKKYHARIAERPAVKAAHQAEQGAQ